MSNKKIIVKKTINLGKIAYYGNRKINAVDVEIEVRECGGDQIVKRDCGFDTLVGYTPKYMELSICGNIWNSRHTDIVCGGQCIDEIAKYIKTPLMQKIETIWKRWHLNGMKAGTPEQEVAVKKYRAEHGRRYDYTELCEYLKQIGLYEVEFTGKTVGRMYDHEPYKYGHAWIIEDLPEWVVKWAKEV